MDAVVAKVREDRRTVNVHVPAAGGVNADGHHDVIGLDIATDEAGAGWRPYAR